MPSSLIFVGLVVLWLLILVPTVARRQQEVARLSPALLSGRVLERPMRHRFPEVPVMERSGPSTVGELVESRDDRFDHDHDVRCTDDAEIDDDGHVHGLDGYGDVPSGRERDPRFAGAVRADVAGYDTGTRGGGSDHDPAGFDDADLDDRYEGDRYENDRADDDRHDAADHADEHGTGSRAAGADTGRSDDLADDLADDEEWEPAPVRYRPGRGGYDPEAAAAHAHAKYAFRQRVVLGLLLLLVASGVAGFLVAPVFWWVTGGLGALLVGYLTYLRRQVRIEESIRARRAARLAGTRRRAGTDREADEERLDREDAGTDLVGTAVPDVATAEPDDDTDWTADDGEPTRVRGTGEPLGVLPAYRRTVDGKVDAAHESSLPKLVAAPPPPVPAGTSLVDVDAEEEPDDLDALPPHRPAVGA
ncbi:gephyrin-like molybdotransferase receptor GlpR [Pseudonocardia nematodicida]|uniref:Gephyrin-like molybdotransferase receptor GlpR n=1 Tax=Pseudonocardia nematodicida TaxID=1206997 RepID=A0ABV1KBX6_9PSEU